MVATDKKPTTHDLIAAGYEIDFPDVEERATKIIDEIDEGKYIELVEMAEELILAVAGHKIHPQVIEHIYHVTKILDQWKSNNPNRTALIKLPQMYANPDLQDPIPPLRALQNIVSERYRDSRARESALTITSFFDHDVTYETFSICSSDYVTKELLESRHSVEYLLNHLLRGYHYAIKHKNTGLASANKNRVLALISGKDLSLETARILASFPEGDIRKIGTNKLVEDNQEGIENAYGKDIQDLLRQTTLKILNTEIPLSTEDTSLQIIFLGGVLIEALKAKNPSLWLDISNGINLIISELYISDETLSERRIGAILALKTLKPFFENPNDYLRFRPFDRRYSHIWKLLQSYERIRKRILKIPNSTDKFSTPEERKIAAQFFEA